jgi:transposase
MKAPTIRRTVSRQQLLGVVEQVPGAWLGLKVAVLVLLLDGYRPTFLAQLFGISRMTLTRWVHRWNREGVAGLHDQPRPGRPTQLTARVRRQLRQHLESPPERFGLPRVVWDGPTLAAHLRRRFGIHVQVRQAQNWLHRLGYRLTRAGYVYLQAKAGDAKRFRQRLKKTSEPDPSRRAGV